MTTRFTRALLLACLTVCAAQAGPSERLSREGSAFLRSFASSPVDWMPWGKEAFERAKREQKPVYLFIGSFSSELAGAMRRQTFANPKAAEWLNAQFICVIVDRDERPEVAALYEQYVTELKQLSGWPLNLWLTPEFLPYEGASYLSPSEDWGAPGFLKLANQAQAAWAADAAACRRHAGEAKAQLAERPENAPQGLNTNAALARIQAATDAWKGVFDATNAGFGEPPKGPEPELLRFLLRRSPEDIREARSTLRALAHSPVRDPLDGGFFRYANDAAWRIPYPQKTLEGQARIALAYLDAASGADAADFTTCARGALDYALARLSRPDGTYASCIDATGDAFIPYFAWTEAEIDRALGADAPAFKKARGVETKGNVSADDDPSGAYAGRSFLGSPAAVTAPGPLEARLLAARDAKTAPPRDERASAAAHGLLLQALANAWKATADRHYLDAARRLADTLGSRFILPDGSARHFADSGLPAGPEDYAALALGLRTLGAAAPDAAAARRADQLLARMDALFYDPASGRFYACASAESAGLFTRPFAPDDAPSASFLAAEAGDRHSDVIVAAILQEVQESSAQAPGDQLLALSRAVALSAPAGR